MNCGYLGKGQARKCGSQTNSFGNEPDLLNGVFKRACVNILFEHKCEPKTLLHGLHTLNTAPDARIFIPVRAISPTHQIVVELI